MFAKVKTVGIVVGVCCGCYLLYSIFPDFVKFVLMRIIAFVFIAVALFFKIINY